MISIILSIGVHWINHPRITTCMAPFQYVISPTRLLPPPN